MAWTLLTWNIRGSAQPDLGDLASVVSGYSPDVVLLQETWRSQADGLAEMTGLAHRLWSFKHKPYGPLLPRRAEGMAILSRTTLTGQSIHVLTPGTGSWTHRRRIMQYARIPDLDLTVVNVHLASHASAKARIEQAERVVAHLGEDRHRCVVAGDFNAVDEPAVFAQFTAIGLDDAWKGDAGFTNPAGAVRQRLDRVLLAGGLYAESVDVPPDSPEWVRRSDHLPVVVRIRDGAGPSVSLR